MEKEDPFGGRSQKILIAAGLVLHTLLLVKGIIRGYELEKRLRVYIGSNLRGLMVLYPEDYASFISAIILYALILSIYISGHLRITQGTWLEETGRPQEKRTGERSSNGVG